MSGRLLQSVVHIRTFASLSTKPSPSVSTRAGTSTGRPGPHQLPRPGIPDRTYGRVALQQRQNALDFDIAQRAEEQAEHGNQMALSAHRLNVLAAFFFPIMTLTSIFGTNLRNGMEEVQSAFPFYGLLIAGLVCGFVLKSVVVRNTKN